MTPASATLDELRAVFTQVTGVQGDEIKPEKALVGDLGLDSLSIVELAVAVGAHFGIQVPDADIATLVTVGDVLRYVEARLGH